MRRVVAQAAQRNAAAAASDVLARGELRVRVAAEHVGRDLAAAALLRPAVVRLAAAAAALERDGSRTAADLEGAHERRVHGLAGSSGQLGAAAGDARRHVLLQLLELMGGGQMAEEPGQRL
eukprot:9466365-Pyramimonas_sp.AAC.1